MAKKQFVPPVKLGQALVLNKYLLYLFGCKDLEELSKDLKDPSLEGIDDEGISKLYYQIRCYIEVASQNRTCWNMIAIL